MNIARVLACTAACFVSTGVFADDLCAALAQAQTDYANARQECLKGPAGDLGEKRDACMSKATAAHKKNVAQIKADAAKAKNAAAEKRRKAIAEATATYLAALKKAEADYDRAAE